MRQTARLFAIALSLTPAVAVSLPLAATLAATPALAADAIYPRGIRVGIVPMPGLTDSQSFLGFESPGHGVKVLLAELPGPAYGEVEAAFKALPDSPAIKIKPQSVETPAGTAYYTAEDAVAGTDKVRRYSLIVPGGKAFSGYVAVQIADSEATNFPEDAVRKMLSTVTVRPEVPVAEQIAQMPFDVREMADFKTVRMLAPGAALLLADGNEDTGIEAAPFMVLGLIGSVPEQNDDRARFAQQAAASIPGLREARITSSEPLRIDSQPGYETRLEGISGKDNTPVTVVQWLRFGSSNVALRVIGSTPRDKWAEAFSRFRKVRDGLKPR